MTTETKKPGRITDYNKKLPVLEVYTCIQSEGSRQGRPTVAIRTTGCTHRCWFGAGGWCDSWYTSIHPEKVSTPLMTLLRFMMKILKSQK